MKNPCMVCGLEEREWHHSLRHPVTQDRKDEVHKYAPSKSVYYPEYLRPRVPWWQWILEGLAVVLVFGLVMWAAAN